MYVPPWLVVGWLTLAALNLCGVLLLESLRRAARQTILEGYDLRSVCLPAMVEYVEGFGPK